MAEAGRWRAGAPAVSVIIPTFNRGAWLPETVASVLSQTHPPLEVLIVDDGSTDETPAVCAGFSDPVRCIRQERAGVGAARNRGAAEARGEWLAFLDSDDLWAPDKLEVQLAALAATGAEWSITGAVVMDLEGRPLDGPQGFDRAFPVFRDMGLSPDRLFDRHLTRSVVGAAGLSHTVYHGSAWVPLFYGNFASPASALLRRDLFRETGGFDERLQVAEDTEFFHRLSAHARVAIVMSPLLRWRTGHAASLVSSNVEESIRNALRSVDRAAALREALPEEARAAYRAGRRSLLTRLAYWQLSVLDRSGARETLREARRSESPVSPSWIALWAASLLPRPLLRGLHAVKRRFWR